LAYNIIGFGATT